MQTKRAAKKRVLVPNVPREQLGVPLHVAETMQLREKQEIHFQSIDGHRKVLIVHVLPDSAAASAVAINVAPAASSFANPFNADY